MDILGLFPKATSKRQFVQMVVDYFTKWIEIEALKKITINNVFSFI